MTRPGRTPQRSAARCSCCCQRGSGRPAVTESVCVCVCACVGVHMKLFLLSATWFRSACRREGVTQVSLLAHSISSPQRQQAKPTNSNLNPNCDCAECERENCVTSGTVTHSYTTANRLPSLLENVEPHPHRPYRCTSSLAAAPAKRKVNPNSNLGPCPTLAATRAFTHSSSP